ncbi:MAG: hypothetical protein RLZZ324_500 [Candidatus Parcubacteria bacterium]|jgi:hypothetical protein
MAAPLSPASDLITESWINFRKNLLSYAEFAVWFCLLGLVLWAIFAFTRSITPAVEARFGLNLLLGLPVYFLGSVLAIALIESVAAHVDGRPLDPRTAFGEGFHKSFSFIWVSLLAGAGVLLGFALVVVPGIVLSVRWRFAQLEMVLENQRGTAAIKASARVTEGRFMETLWRLLAPAVFFAVAGIFVTGLIRLLVGAILGDPGLFFSLYDSAGSLPLSHDLLATLIPTAVNGFLWPLYIGAEYILWRELKKG